MQNDFEEQREYRKENFKIETDIDTDFLTGWETMALSITPNGHQWFTIEFTEEEWKQIKMEGNLAWKTNVVLRKLF